MLQFFPSALMSKFAIKPKRLVFLQFIFICKRKCWNIVKHDMKILLTCKNTKNWQLSFLALYQLFFFYMNWKYKVTVNMPFDKNIFTKKCTFLYNSCQVHTSPRPETLVKNDPKKLSTCCFSIILIDKILLSSIYI